MMLRAFVAVVLLSLGVELAAAPAVPQRVRTALQNIGQHADKVKNFAKHTGIAAGA